MITDEEVEAACMACRGNASWEWIAKNDKELAGDCRFDMRRALEAAEAVRVANRPQPFAYGRVHQIRASPEASEEYDIELSLTLPADNNPPWMPLYTEAVRPKMVEVGEVMFGSDEYPQSVKWSETVCLKVGTKLYAEQPK